MSAGIVANASLGVGSEIGIGLGINSNTLLKDVSRTALYEGMEAAVKLKANNILKFDKNLTKINPLRTGSTFRAGLAKVVSKVATPVSLVLQLVPMLLDGFWDPYFSYDKKALKELRIQYEKSMKEIFKDQGLDYPLIITPSVLETDEKGEIILDAEFMGYLDEYLRKNGLYIQDEEKEVYDNVTRLKRKRALTLAANENLNSLYNMTNINTIGRRNVLIAALVAKNIKRRKDLEKEAEQIKLNYMLTIVSIILIVYVITFVL
jgi:hypothetical protein